VKHVLALVAALAAAVAFTGTAGASEIIGRNAESVTLGVDKSGYALVTYSVRGRTTRVLASGAVNALHPKRGGRQIDFDLDYSGGWGTFKQPYWKTFRNACTRYDGPRLAWLVKACKAPDGSYWALQAWQRALPNYGLAANATQAVWELRLSHWTGELPVFTVKTNWVVWGKQKPYDHLYGRLTYQGRPVFGFKSKPNGEPLDTWGRNVYLDTFGSDYGAGWHRENSFLVHNPGGNFCYGVYKHRTDDKIGKGTRYRATIIGPGVLPDLFWQGISPGPYDAAKDAVANVEQRQLAARDKLCQKD
jgi:hypothetical protein